MVLTHFGPSNAAQSRIPDLPAMTEQIRPLLTVVLSIPPFSTSAALRSSYLLRLTGDVQEGVAIFGLSDYQFAALSEFFDLLDRGWHCCLSGHVWDSAAQTGVPVAVDSDFDNADGHTPPSAPRGVPSTDRVRLSSLLLNLRESLRQALALPDGDEPSEGTPALVSDISTEATSEAQSSRRSTSVATGDGAAAMDMVLDPDADDSDDEDQAGIASAIPVDDPTAGELEESIQRLFGRSFALLSEL